MTNIKEIDVIMPLYETSISYVKEALLSVATQRISDKIKVTIIDDCSKTDYSSIVDIFGKIIDLNYIKLPENHGVGYARQYGIDNTDATYITFLDSDDAFYNEYSLEMLYEKIKEKNHDFVSGSFYREYLSDNADDTQLKSLPLSSMRLGKVPGLNSTWVFSRLYSRNFLVSNNIRFNEMRYNEDVCFMQMILCLSNNTTTIDNAVYVQHSNMNSLTRTNGGEFQQGTKGIVSFVNALSYVHRLKRERGIINTDISKMQMCDGIAMSYWYFVKCYADETNEECEKLLVAIQEFYNLVTEDFKDICKSQDLKKSYFLSCKSASDISDVYIPYVTFYELLDDLEANKNEVKYDGDCKYQFG